MKILFAYDGVKNSARTFEVARSHAVAFNAEVHIFTASGHSPELHTAEIAKLEAQLKEIKDRFDADHIPCQIHTVFRSLSPGEDLVDFARQNNMDEIIIGVKHRSKIGKLIMGSTAQFVILEASCPVVTVK
jgi:nucleotide-binding universal stress UspA family protein